MVSISLEVILTIIAIIIIHEITTRVIINQWLLYNVTNAEVTISLEIVIKTVEILAIIIRVRVIISHDNLLIIMLRQKLYVHTVRNQDTMLPNVLENRIMIGIITIRETRQDRETRVALAR